MTTLNVSSRIFRSGNFRKAQLEEPMRKVVLAFGLISGAISSLMMVLTLPFMETIGLDRAEIIGYATLVLSFLMVFFGIRSYRDNAGGTIGFVQAFKVGILITLISCACYVVTWEILYFNFFPDFWEKYAKAAAQQIKASSASAATIQAQLDQMERFGELYRNPIFNVAMTFIEPFPVGLIITLISSIVLRRTSEKRI
jgi:hypothetical protein